MEMTPEVNYTILRVAMQMYEKTRDQLNEQELQAVMQQANRELAIAKKLLDSELSSQAVITDAAIEKSFSELKERFNGDTEFYATLEHNSLDEGQLKQALAYQLRVEAILEQLLNQGSQVSDEEVEIYYYQHLERFDLPETRTARHILITINDDYPENRRNEVEKRMNKIQSKLGHNPDAFMELATKYSECPTAMHEGLLGRVKSGQLYPELDRTLFNMEEGAISDILSSPVGLHLLWCETIHPAERLAFSEVKEKLREHLESKKRKRMLKEWLKQAA
jgi:nitrogen fixation protein NifM